MGHQENAAGKFLQVGFQPADHLRVQVVGRLVQQQQVRRVDQGGGQGHPLSLAPGEGTHFLLQVRNAQPGQDLHRLIPGDLPGGGVQPRLHLVNDRLLRVKGGILGQVAQAHIGVIADLSPVRGFPPRGCAEKGGFAAAVDADDSHPVSFLHEKVDVIQQRPVPIGFPDAHHIQKHGLLLLFIFHPVSYHFSGQKGRGKSPSVSSTPGRIPGKPAVEP